MDNPYQAYFEGSVVSVSPMSLVVKLYEGAVGALEQAQVLLQSGDVMGRGKAVNRVVNILTELLSSLDHQRGEEISKNLAGLYCYIQGKVIEGHLKKASQPFQEAENLMRNLLDGWREAEKRMTAQSLHATSSSPEPECLPEDFQVPLYGYPPEMQQGLSSLSASF